MAVDLEPDEDRQAEPGPRAADLRVVPGDDPARLERLDPAQARGRREPDRVREVDVRDPAVLLQPRYDGTIHLVRNMVWHKIKPSASSVQFISVGCLHRRDICHRVWT